MTLEEMAARIAELDVRRRMLKEHDERLKGQRAELEADLLRAFEDGNVPRLTVGEQSSDPLNETWSGCEHCRPLDIPATTVHMRRELWISAPEGKEAAIDAMRDAGAGVLVSETYHAGSASAWMRELDRDNDDMPVFPPAVRGRLGVSEKFSVRTRRG